MVYDVSMVAVSRGSAIFAFALALCWGAPAEACPTCVALDPSIAPPGTESIGAGAYRLGAQLRIRTFEESGTRIEERRVGFNASIAALERMAVELRWQFAHQTLSAANLAELRRTSFADPYVGVRAIAFRNRRIAPDHLVSLRLGVTVPFGSSREDPRIRGPYVSARPTI